MTNLFKFNKSLITDKEDIPFILVIERFKSSTLNLDLLRASIKKSDKEVIRYFKQNGYISLYRKFNELFEKHKKNLTHCEFVNSLNIPKIDNKKAKLLKIINMPFSDYDDDYDDDEFDSDLEDDEIDEDFL